MTDAAGLLDTLNQLDVGRESKAAIGRTKDGYLDLNREQLLEGRRADGTRMPNYSYHSVILYGKPDGPILLYETGAFQDSFRLDVGSTELEILAEDLYGLEDRFENEIYGLTERNQEYYNQEVFFPELMSAVEELTGL